MKLIVVAAVVVMAGVAVCRPDKLFGYEAKDHKHEQYGDPGKSVRGSYSWTSPEGYEYVINYIADHHGFRIIDPDSGAIPETEWGGRADGHQGSFSDGTDHLPEKGGKH